MTFPYKHALEKVPGRGVPPRAFIDTLIAQIAKLPAADFAPNANHDIYGALEEKLGPWISELQRRAAMCAALLKLGMLESSALWTCGVDMEKGAGTGRPKTAWETGAFQVSADSMNLAPTLRKAFIALAGSDDVDTFLSANKRPEVAVPYVVELLRVNTRWDGPIDRGEVTAEVSPALVAELQPFIKEAMSQ